jgi:hypothetical protein
MALATFDDLKAAIISYDGSDNISQHLDDAIAVTESRMFANEVEILRLRPTETKATDTTSTSTRFLSLPANFLSFRAIRYVLDGDDVEIEYRAPTVLRESSITGRPEYYTVTSQIEFERIPDSAYTVEMDYYAKVVALSDSNTTNTVLTNNPEIYINGCMWFINSLPNGEQELGGYYEQEFYKGIRGANREFDAGRYGPTPVRRTTRCIP